MQFSRAFNVENKCGNVVMYVVLNLGSFNLGRYINKHRLYAEKQVKRF